MVRRCLEDGGRAGKRGGAVEHGHPAAEEPHTELGGGEVGGLPGVQLQQACNR